MSRVPVCVAGTGLCVPAPRLASGHLERSLGLEAGWVDRRTGILERRIAPADVAVSDLAVAAGESAICAAGIAPSAVSLLVLATSTPDHLLPPTAPAVAARLGLTAPAFDLAAACTGFLYGYAVGVRWLAGRCASAGREEAVLVIAANVLSRRINWCDRDTAPLFGDGAGAVVLREAPSPIGGVIGMELSSDGERWRDIQVPAGGSRKPATVEAVEAREMCMVMRDGRSVFRYALRAMVESAQRVLGAAGTTAAEIDWFVPHQAGAKLVRGAAAGLGIPDDRVVANFERYGNTSAASIPMALHEAAADGRVRPGNLVLMAAAGAGMTAGAVLVRWAGAVGVKMLLIPRSERNRLLGVQAEGEAATLYNAAQSYVTTLGHSSTMYRA